MLEPKVVIFHEDDIDRIIHECLVYPRCKIMVAVGNSKIKDVASMFFEHINQKVLTQPVKISDNRANNFYKWRGLVNSKKYRSIMRL